MYLSWSGPRPEFHLIKTNEASHFHIYVTLRALSVVVIKSDDEKFGTRRDYSIYTYLMHCTVL